MTNVATNDVALAIEWSTDLLGGGSPAAFFLAPDRFDSAVRTADSFSVTLRSEGLFGLGFGSRPPLNPLWTRCSISGSRFGPRLGVLVATGAWDFYAADTTGASWCDPIEIVEDDGEVARLLDEHAPHSQVWPGDPEIERWYGLRGPSGWASVAALVRWESGYHVLSSVATAGGLRGQGFAQRLVRGVLVDVRDRGVRWVGLGVSHENVAAQRVYANVGFQLRANFTSYGVAADG